MSRSSGPLGSLLGLSWGALEALLNYLGSLLGRLWAFLRASSAVLERSEGPLMPSGTMGKRNMRERKYASKTIGK
eukprot:8113005-Pyramimonas_sp.AAC.1